MTTKKVQPRAPRGKASAPGIENLALLLAGVIANPATPEAVREGIRNGLSQAFNELPHPDGVLCSPEYIALLFTQHGAQKGGE